MTAEEQSGGVYTPPPTPPPSVTDPAPNIVDQLDRVGQKLDELAAYPLDQREIEVSITIPGRNLRPAHRLNRPTLEQLINRDAAATYQTEEISSAEDRARIDDEAANARLYDEIIGAVRGYILPGETKEEGREFRVPSAKLKAQIPAGHKATVIRGMYDARFELEASGGGAGDQEDDDVMVVGAQQWVVKQTIGDPDAPSYIIRHTLRSPTEAERREFRQGASEVRFARGTRKTRTKVLTHLKAHVKLYDLLIQDLDGVSITSAGGQTETMQPGSMAVEGNRAKMVALVDPVWKRNVIDALMKAFEGDFIGLTDALDRYFTGRLAATRKAKGVICPGEIECGESYRLKMFRPEGRTDAEICGACDRLATKPTNDAPHLTGLINHTLELAGLKEAGARFQYPDALDPYEWGGLAALQRARGKDDAEQARELAERQEREANEARLRAMTKGLG